MTSNLHMRSALAALALAGSLIAGTPFHAGAQTNTTPGAAPAPEGRAAGGDAAESTLTGEAAGATRIATEPDERISVTRADYPTSAIADYVFACMATNGETQSSLDQCSCSFDVVASIIPYDRYVEASTWLSMRQVTGEKGSLFRDAAESKAAIGDLRRAQAEAEIRCFE